MGKTSSGKHKKSSKRTRSRDSSSSSSSSSSLSSIDEKTKRKLKKKIKKLRKKEKQKKKAERKALKELKKSSLKEALKKVKKTETPSSSSCDVDVSLMEKSKSLAPMTKEEWEKQQNTFKRVFDEETGRTRLVKGTGEIVEECVSRERHLAINKQATRGDDKMEKSDVVEEFYGVYLLKCLNPKYKGQTYIGYTVDPNRRIKQHNKGKLFGGARRTSKRGPWEMTLTVHGFPSDIAALRFEWAWQHPTRSRRLRSLIKKKKNSETAFQYNLKVMFTMLKVPPWCRLPLTVRWLSADVMVDPPPNLAPPMHMPIIYGPVISKKLNSPKKKIKSIENSQEDREEEFCICKLCHEIANKNDTLICLKNECQAKWHVVCVAKYFLERELSFVANQAPSGQVKDILPVEGSCSECDSVMLWGDLVRKKNGCYCQETRTQSSSGDNTILNSSLNS